MQIFAFCMAGVVIILTDASSASSGPDLMAHTGRMDIPKVEIISTAYRSPWPDPITLPYMQPVIDTALADLRKKYGGLFNLSHTYVFDENIRDCPTQKAEISVLLSRYVLGRPYIPDMTALISTGKIWHFFSATLPMTFDLCSLH
jgi:hypothetical protein